MNKKIFFTTLLLVISGLAIFYCRISILKTPIFPTISSSQWEVEVKIEKTAKEPLSNITLYIPSSKIGAKVIQESIRSSGLAAAVFEELGNRHLVWSGKTLKNLKTPLYYNVVLETGTKKISSPHSRKKKNTTPFKLLSEDELIEAKKFAKHHLKFAKNSHAFVNRTVECVRTLDCLHGDFLGRFRTSEKKITKVVGKLAQLAGFKAYVARGFIVTKSERISKFRYWLRVLNKKVWADIPVIEDKNFTQDNILFWDYLEAHNTFNNKNELSLLYSIAPLESSWLQDVPTQEEFKSLGWRILSLRNVPISVQALYRTLLLIPIGALVITLLRSFIGLQMFGTFMPILIALSFRETGLYWGVALLSMVVTFGLLVRFLLKRLQLLLVPRLSATLMIVVLLIICLSRLSYESGFAGGLSVTLFPIVIITMIIERMSISWEEVGPQKTLVLFFNSMVAAVLGYSSMVHPLVDYWVFAFPEVILILLAITILCGRYTYYRVLELYRFRSFSSL